MSKKIISGMQESDPMKNDTCPKTGGSCLCAPVQVSISVGNTNRDNRCGDFYNALDELVSHFIVTTVETNDTYAGILRMYADWLVEEER